MSLLRQQLIVHNLLLHGKIKKAISHAHMCSLEERARKAHDQNEQTLPLFFPLKNSTFAMIVPATYINVSGCKVCVVNEFPDYVNLNKMGYIMVSGNSTFILSM